jgi:hypothetical protein
MRRRPVVLLSALTVVTIAACTISPLNPQPLPPRDDDPEAAPTFGDSGATFRDDGGRGSDMKTPPNIADAGVNTSAPDAETADGGLLDGGDAGDADADAGP